MFVVWMLLNIAKNKERSNFLALEGCHHVLVSLGCLISDNIGKSVCLSFKDQLGETFFSNSKIVLHLYLQMCVFNKDFQYLIHNRDK